MLDPMTERKIDAFGNMSVPKCEMKNMKIYIITHSTFFENVTFIKEFNKNYCENNNC